METPDPASFSAYGLPFALQQAIADIIAGHTGQSLSLPVVGEQLRESQPLSAADLSMAIAYTNLLLQDPDAVTQRHLKMLRSHFTIEQIYALNRFIKEKTGL